MALKSCRECGKEVSTEAKTCPHCGVENPAWVPLTKRNLTPAQALLAVVVIVVIAVALGYNFLVMVGPDEPASHSWTTEQPHDKLGAWTACQEFVKRRLVAPATADFPWNYDAYTTHLGGGGYRVASYVDAENRFGAKLRTTFDCTVIYQQADNSWNLENLDLTER